MDKKIKEVQDYFKAKLLSNKFEITEISQYTLNLLIDGKYNFAIWIGNWTIKDCTGLCNDSSFMSFTMNQKERLKLHSVLRKPVEEYQNSIILNDKRKLFEQLKKELGA